jgi:ArsR family transcriptional regulator
MKKVITLAQAIFDEERLQIIKLLQLREMRIIELADLIDRSQARISQHIAVLRRAKVVKERREDKTIAYALVPKTLHELTTLWNNLLDEPIGNLPEMSGIWKRLNTPNSTKVKTTKTELTAKKRGGKP